MQGIDLEIFLKMKQAIANNSSDPEETLLMIQKIEDLVESIATCAPFKRRFSCARSGECCGDFQTLGPRAGTLALIM